MKQNISINDFDKHLYQIVKHLVDDILDQPTQSLKENLQMLPNHVVELLHQDWKDLYEHDYLEEVVIKGGKW